ncbi:MAG: DUF3726 domain-containing protein [Gammaproteobacteria bacterium]|nr:DUF3726 domain-containing protein [Gammaproteobacteria bacterium]
MSHAEVERLCRKVLAALGMAGGIERDAALAVLWLEARGLGGLARLRAALPALAEAHDAAPAALAASGGETRYDAHGQCALLVAPSLVDVARAGAERSASCMHRVVVERTADPLFALAVAAIAGPPEAAFRLRWREHEGARAARVAADGTVSIERASGGDAALVIECMLGRAAGADDAAARGAAIEIDAATLEARRGESLARGIAVDGDDWQALSAVAAGALVPDTADSHERGAGGGRYDD